MAKFVEGWVCAFGNQRLCFESSLSVSDWASWAQAVGSIGAILATIAVVELQHLKTRRLAEAARRDNEMLNLNRAMLACYGDFNAAVAGAEYFANASDDMIWPFSCDVPTVTEWLATDLDSLAFLVERRAQEVLTGFSVLRAKAGRMNNMKNSLADFQRDEINPPLEQALTQKGSLTLQDMHEAVGPRKMAVFDRRVGDLASTCEQLAADLQDGIPALRARILKMYPEIVLPVHEQATTHLFEPIR